MIRVSRWHGGFAPWDLDACSPYWRQWLTVVMHEDAAIDYERDRKADVQHKRESLRERAKVKAREFMGRGRA